MIFKNFVPVVHLMTRKILFLITAMLVLGVSTTALVNAQEMPTSVEVTSFPFNESVMENGKITFNNTNGTSTMNFVAYGWFDGTVRIGESLTIELPTKDCGTTCFVEGIYYIKDLNQGNYSELQIVAAPEPEPKPVTTGNGTIEVHVYEIPFDVTILEGGKVVYHNLDPVTYHNLEHTGTTGTEKGGTFSMWAGSNGGTATANFPVENCSSCYPAGVYSWMDSVSGVTGAITILPNPNTVNEQVGIQENVVVVLNKPEPTIQTNSTVTTEQQDILDKTKSYKTQIEEKINAKIKPLETEIIDLKKQVDFVTSVNTDFVKEINLLKTNATISETKYLEESKINKELREKLSTLESQAVDTTELEKYKKDASNWKAVALEQLRVMAEILGLF